MFELDSAGLHFASSGLSYLVVTNSDTKAYYQGTGSINGVSGYTFVVSVTDGDWHHSDTFRIKVYNTATGVVAYDNQYGAADDADATQPINCGAIVILG